jgi:hypothetical protein
MKRMRMVCGAIVAELRRLNNARMTPRELRALTRSEQASRVKADLVAHHHREARCC